MPGVPAHKAGPLQLQLRVADVGDSVPHQVVGSGIIVKQRVAGTPRMAHEPRTGAEAPVNGLGTCLRFTAMSGYLLQQRRVNLAKRLDWNFDDLPVVGQQAVHFPFHVRRLGVNGR